MTTVRKTVYFNRPDTMLGVCQGIADDMGINANWLRVAFAVAFFFYPLQAALAYVGLGAFAALLRKVWPDEVAANEAEVLALETRATGDDDLPLAA